MDLPNLYFSVSRNVEGPTPMRCSAEPRLPVLMIP